MQTGNSPRMKTPTRRNTSCGDTKDEINSSFLKQTFCSKIQSLAIATANKERLNKRREKIQSMRYIRMMGKKLREQQEQMVKALIKKDKIEKRSQSKKNLFTNNGLEFRCKVNPGNNSTVVSDRTTKRFTKNVPLHKSANI